MNLEAKRTQPKNYKEMSVKELVALILKTENEWQHKIAELDAQRVSETSAERELLDQVASTQLLEMNAALNELLAAEAAKK